MADDDTKVKFGAARAPAPDRRARIAVLPLRPGRRQAFGRAGKRIFTLLGVLALLALAPSAYAQNLTLKIGEPNPVLTSATIPSAGTTMVLNFNKAVSVGSGGSGGWAPTLSGGAATMTYYSGAGTNSFTYNLSRTVQIGETGTVAYTQPGAGLEDSSGDYLTSISAASVTDNSTQCAAPSAPTGISDTVTASSLTPSWTNGTGSSSSTVNWGTTSSYGTTINPDTSVTPITGLASSTLYHYDVCANNACGTTCSSDHSDTTSGTCSDPAWGKLFNEDFTVAKTGYENAGWSTKAGTVNPATAISSGTSGYISQMCSQGFSASLTGQNYAGTAATASSSGVYVQFYFMYTGTGDAITIFSAQPTPGSAPNGPGTILLNGAGANLYAGNGA